MTAYFIGTFCESWINIQQFPCKKINSKMTSEIGVSSFRPLCVYVHKTYLCPRTREKHCPSWCKHSMDVYDWFLVHITFCCNWSRINIDVLKNNLLSAMTVCAVAAFVLRLSVVWFQPVKHTHTRAHAHWCFPIYWLFCWNVMYTVLLSVHWTLLKADRMK